MTGPWIAAIAGALVAAGLVGLLWYLVPARPDVVTGVDRLLTPARPHQIAEIPTTSAERVGNWTLRHLPPELWRMAPLRDLEILRRSASGFYGEKTLNALIGLVAVPVLVWVLSFAGLQVPIPVPVGATLGIVGPSGSGKTTLTRLLQKVYFPSTGTIRINDCYLNEIDTAHLRRNMGVVLQENFLFHATVADNIRAGQSAATRQQIIQAALLAGADEFIVTLPQGYDTMLEEGAKNLSGGQRQRLAIARALLTSPEILILDEATSSLDPESERIVRENLAQIASNRTVIIVSHRLSMLRDADSIIVLQRGAMVGHGPHQHLMQECSLYKKLWQQQMEL